MAFVVSCVFTVESQSSISFTDSPLMQARPVVQSVPSNDTARSQRWRIPWADVQVVQYVALNDWSNSDFINNHMHSPSGTGIRGSFNWRLSRPVGVFADMGVSFHNAPRYNQTSPGEIIPLDADTRHFIVEDRSRGGYNGAGANLKMTFGLFSQINLSGSDDGRWTLLPYLGVGFTTINAPSYDYVTKEEGTNNYYNTWCSWLGDDPYEYESTLGCLNARINLTYKIRHRFRILLGVEYTLLYNGVDFYARYSNYFNGRVVREFHQAGNNVGLLGFSLGMSFR